MIFLLLAIVGSGLIPVLFRGFQDWRVNVTWAIPVNYLVCAIVGSVFGGEILAPAFLLAQPWLPLAAAQGVILAVNFFLLAFTAQRAGVSVAALASRLSVAIPSILAFVLYGDALDVPRAVGLAGALGALYLCTASEPLNRADHSWAVTLLPVLVFFTFGGYFTIIKYAQARYLDESSYHAYVMSGFCFAFLTSVVICAGQAFSPVKRRFQSILGGVVLGVVNYLAVYGLVKMLALQGWQTSQLYPLYSVGVVAVSTLLALLFFGERLSRRRKLGLAVGLLALLALNR
jgi:drug/metabolite transporter (DMT)-like permease